MEMKDYAGATACLNRALEIDPNFGPAWHNLGRMFGRQNNYSEAIRYLKKALEIDSANAGALLHLGAANIKIANLRDAVLCFTSAYVLRFRIPPYLRILLESGVAELAERVLGFNNIANIDLDLILIYCASRFDEELHNEVRAKLNTA